MAERLLQLYCKVEATPPLSMYRDLVELNNDINKTKAAAYDDGLVVAKHYLRAISTMKKAQGCVVFDSPVYREIDEFLKEAEGEEGE